MANPVPAGSDVSAGTYKCTNCGNQIGEKRLSAVPWTPYCIDCQELQEKGLLA